jgi:OmpA-OmpF porin, OOP family
MPSDELFAPRSANFTDNAYPFLDRVAGLLPLYEKAVVRVDGFSDDKAKQSFLRLLTSRQAQVVSDYLWPHKLDAAMIYAHGFGHEHPISSNATEAGQEINRRIMISFRYFPVVKTYN